MDPSLSAPFHQPPPPSGYCPNTAISLTRSLAPRHFVLDIPSVFRILFPSQPAFVSRRRGLTSAQMNLSKPRR